MVSTLSRLTEAEHHVITLTPEIDLSQVEDYATVYCINHKGWASLISSCLKIRKLVRELAPDVVHSHLFLSSAITRLALGRRWNIVYSIHNLYSETIFKKPHLRMLEKHVYREHHRLIAVSNVVLCDYKKVVTRCKNGAVLYNFIDDAFFEKELADRTGKRGLQKWIAVGSLKEQKNYQGLISLFTAFYNQAIDKEGLCLDIYGDGPLRSKLAHTVRDLPFITLKGMVQHLPGILDEYDAFISLSKYEGYGIAPMEALVRGLPLFLSDIPVYKEIYGDYACFITLGENRDVDFIKSCERYSMMSDAEKERRMTAGRYYACKTAGGNSYVSRLLDLYNTSVQP